MTWKNLTEEQRAESRARAKKNWYLKQQGQGGYVDAAEIQQRIRKLHDEHQITFQRISEKAGVDVTIVKWHYQGYAWPRPHEPLTQCTWRVHNAIMTTVFGPADVAAQIRSHGTQRRLRALVAAGFPQHWLAEATGRSTAAVNNFLVKSRKFVDSEYAAAVEQVYRKYIDTDPVTVGVTSRARACALKVAAKRAWEPGHCWDDDTIDNPDAIPEWTGACGTQEGYRIHIREEIPPCDPCRETSSFSLMAARFDPTKFRILMEQSGFNADLMAERLGVTTDSIRRWAKGQRLPQRHHIDEICRALDCEFSDISIDDDGTVWDDDFDRVKFCDSMEERGVTKYALAKQVGVSNMAVHYWCTGKSTPKIPKIVKAAEVLGVDWMEFYR